VDSLDISGFFIWNKRLVHGFLDFPGNLEAWPVIDADLLGLRAEFPAEIVIEDEGSGHGKYG